MKNYFIRAIVSAVAYTIVYLLLDIVFGNMQFRLFVLVFYLGCLVFLMIKVGIRGRR